MKKTKLYLVNNLGWILLISLGIALRLRQYFFNRSLWNDEASLALNLVSRSFGELTRPLGFEQGAPVAFLWVIKFFITILGNHDYVLRLFPLISGILALLLLMRVAKTNVGEAGLFALAVWSITAPAIYYTTELKQYGNDAMIVLLLLYLAHFCLDKPSHPWKFITLGLAGALALWISHPSAFILAAIGAVLLIDKITGKITTPYKWIFILGCVWVLSFVLLYFVSLQNLIANDFLQGYWKKAFMPLPPWSNKRWFLNTYFYLVSITTSTTDWTLGITLAILATVGAISLFIRNRSFGLMLFLSFTFSGLASVLHKYPLKDRFMLFLSPLFLILIAEAIAFFYRASRKITPHFAWVLPVIASLFILTYVKSGINVIVQPFTQAEIKPVLGYVAQNQRPGDIIYVYHTGVTSFLYYAPFYGIDDLSTAFGNRTTQKKQALNSFYDDVQSLQKNNRVWFIFSDIVDCGGCDGDMQDFYVKYLDTVGVNLQHINSIGANGYLYDLSQ